MNAIRKLIITGLGTGCLPIAPGTWGSLPACAVWLLAAWASDGSPMATGLAAGLSGLLFAAGCVVTGKYAQETYGRKDPPRNVSDEWAGQALTLIALPMGAGPADWWKVAVSAFLAFRLFDILKPPPARRLEKLPLGWGVLLDDLAAGVYANVLCQIFLRVVLGL